MAITIPRLGDRVQETATPNVRVDTNAPLEAFGGGESAARLGASTDRMLGQVEKFALEEKKKADDTATTDAYVKLASHKQDLSWNPQTGVMTRKGKDAFGALDEYGAKFDSYADELEAGLSNEDQRELFRRIRAKERLDFDGQLQKHIFQESQQFQSETTKAGMLVSRNEAILNYSDPDKITKSIALQESLILKDAAGKPPALVQAEIEDARSKTHIGVISQMLAQNKDQLAKKHYDENSKFLTADDNKAALNALEQGTVLGESQRQASSIMSQAKGDLRLALDQARQIPDPKIQEGTVREIKTRFAEDEAAKKSFEDKRLHGIINQITQTKERPNQAVFSSLSPEDKRVADAWLEHVRKGTEPQTKWTQYYDLMTLASSPATKNEFMRENLGRYRNDLADSEFKELVKIQAGLREKDDKSEKLLDDFRTDKDVVDTALRKIGVDPSPKDTDKSGAEKVTEFRRAVARQQVALQQRLGRKATADEMQQIVDNLTVQTVIEKHWYGDKKKRAYQLEPGETGDIDIKSVPRIERSKIEDALRRNNVPVSDDKILELYSRNLQRMVSRGY